MNEDVKTNKDAPLAVDLQRGVMPHLIAILKYDVRPLQFEQFTIDWLEDIEDRPLCPGSFKYEVDNILEIMNPKKKDYRFFKALSDLIGFAAA